MTFATSTLADGTRATAHLARSLSHADRPILGTFSPSQNTAILSVAITSAAVSLIATLITLRWFVLMNRLFRHNLVLCLIISDTVKALSYFIFPIVLFARGPVSSDSKWCQASGFFLALSLEASDTAILLIALHAVLYIFRPPIRFGEGGLYPYRKWVPVLWLFWPILAASIAFVNHGKAYVTAGTFCYLPQRPYWYRLALAWIPRYLILIAILLMYAAISLYVRIKFRSFKNLEGSEASSGFQSGRKLSLENAKGSGSPTGNISPGASSPSVPLSSQRESTASTIPSAVAALPATPSTHEPWESMSFITTTPLIGSAHKKERIAAADFAAPRVASDDTLVLPMSPKSGYSGSNEQRKASEAPTTDTATTEDSHAGSSHIDSTIDDPRDKIITDPLKRTRLAIRQQLRFLFFYPAVYLLMWAFPFANHCQLYSDRLATHPIFWLQVVSTCSLALQAAANCAIFSSREKPWRRIDEASKFSILFWRHQGANFVKNIHSRHTSNAMHQRRTTDGTDITAVELEPPKPQRPPLWWEAEGRKRKDSVWMGTDRTTYGNSRDGNAASVKSREDTIEEEETTST